MFCSSICWIHVLQILMWTACKGSMVSTEVKRKKEPFAELDKENNIFKASCWKRIYPISCNKRLKCLFRIMFEPFLWFAVWEIFVKDIIYWLASHWMICLLYYLELYLQKPFLLIFNVDLFFSVSFAFFHLVSCTFLHSYLTQFSCVSLHYPSFFPVYSYKRSEIILC